MEEDIMEIDKIEILQDSNSSLLSKEIAETIDNYKKKNYTCVGSDTTAVIDTSVTIAKIYKVVTLKFKKNC